MKIVNIEMENLHIFSYLLDDWGISIKISGKTAYYNIKTLKKAVSLSLSKNRRGERR